MLLLALTYFLRDWRLRGHDASANLACVCVCVNGVRDLFVLHLLVLLPRGTRLPGAVAVLELLAGNGAMTRQ